jgi:N-acetylglutamate synthase-like GNAT family acetyltransferase
MESLKIREPHETDWPAILAVANESVARIPGAGPQDEWLRNRRSFDLARGVQQQLIAEASGSPVGYAALESRDPAKPRSFRLFVVCAPQLLETVGEHLYAELQSRLRKLGATDVWFQEYASDAEFIAFARRRGFSKRGCFAFQGTEIIVLAKSPVPGEAAA